MAVCLVALGAAAIAYGVLMAALYPAGGFFAVWLALGAAACAAGWAVRADVWAALPVLLRRGLAGLALVLVVAAGACSALIARDAMAAPPAGLDYLIVLGAQVDAQGRPKEALRYRLDAAAGYLAKNPATTCIVSGGRGKDEPCSEASVMAAYLKEAGVDEGRIVREARSTTTAENRASRASLSRMRGRLPRRCRWASSRTTFTSVGRFAWRAPRALSRPLA